MTFDELQLGIFDQTEKESLLLQKKMIAEYDRALRSINDEIKTVYAKILDGVSADQHYVTMLKYDRLTKLQSAIFDEYKKSMRAVGGLINTNSELSINNVYYRSLYAVNWTQPTNIFIALNPSIVEASVYSTSKIWDSLKKATQEKIIKTYGSINSYYPQSGTLLNELLKKNNAIALDRIETSLRQGLIQGQGFRKTAASIRDVMGNNINQSIRIAITEGHRNMTAGNYAAMEAARSEGVDGKRKIVSVRDMRTRPQSAQVDGKIENDEGYFTYPGGVLVKIPGNSGVAKWDIRDREAVVMVVDGFDSEETRAYNPVTKKTDIISKKPFDEWMSDNNLSYDSNGKIIYTP